MQRIKILIISSLIVLGMTIIPLSSSASALVNINDAKKETASGACTQKGGATEADDTNGKTCTKEGSDIMGIFRTVANVLLFLVGAVAVVILIVGGFRYVTSNGDANSVTAAKNTIMYAIIGIVVAFLAYAAVSFVTQQLTKGSA
ncbi:MAG: pilin [Patescibacteria group bacterium]